MAREITDQQQMIDVSHTVEHGMVTYKGLPAPIICDYLSREESREHYADGTEFHIGRIDMVANTGTYVDSPFHRYKDGKDLSELTLASVANLSACVIRVKEGVRAITPDLFAGQELEGKAVLIDTGWDRYWRTEQYFSEHPYLTREAAQYLAEHKVAFAGIDSLNIDDTEDGYRPAHTILLGAGIPVGEHLCNLSELPDTGFRFFAVPAKVKNFGTFPVRAFGIID